MNRIFDGVFQPHTRSAAYCSQVDSAAYFSRIRNALHIAYVTYACCMIESNYVCKVRYILHILESPEKFLPSIGVRPPRVIEGLTLSVELVMSKVENMYP